MSSWIVPIMGLLLAAPAAAPAAEPAASPVKAPIVLSCALSRSTSTVVGQPAGPVDQLVRLGPGTFQVWKPEERAFGPNLCRAFDCGSNPAKTEGTITSASVAYTIGIDNKTGAGYWRAAGATALTTTSGACSHVADPTTKAH